MEDKTKKITDQVTSRLDDLFGEGSAAPGPADNSPVEIDQQHFLLEELNAIILSIEWEISDEIMTRLLAEIGNLEKEFQDDKIISAFLQLQGSLGRYIHKNKANAHPESINLLHSIHTTLEKIATSPDMQESDKKIMLAEKIKQYKDLKNQITRAVQAKQTGVESTPQNNAPQQPPAAEQKSHAAESDTISHGKKPFPDNEIATQLLEEIRIIIQDEFKKLKDEILSRK